MQKYTEDEAIAFTRNTLDSMDIREIAVEAQTRTIEGLIEKLSTLYDNTSVTNNECMEGFLFNWMNESEFLDYLTSRYNGKFGWREIITHAIWFI